MVMEKSNRKVGPLWAAEPGGQQMSGDWQQRSGEWAAADREQYWLSGVGTSGTWSSFLRLRLESHQVFVNISGLVLTRFIYVYQVYC